MTLKPLFTQDLLGKQSCVNTTAAVLILFRNRHVSNLSRLLAFVLIKDFIEFYLLGESNYSLGLCVFHMLQKNEKPMMEVTARFSLEMHQ